MKGAPSKFTQEIEDEICDRLTKGESLVKMCDDEHMPNPATVYRWLAVHDSFREKYASAREAQADAIFDEILDIADDGRNDWMESVDDEGAVLGYKFNGEAARRSQIRIDARKWMAGKLRPKKYGDKVEVEHSGGVDLKHSLTDMTDEELAAIATGSSTGATGKA